jgi:hypothetical protein
MKNNALSTATAQDAAARLAAVVRDLSGRWPNLLGPARPSELPITPEELGAVLATWDRSDFADALARCDVDALRVRASNPVTMTAVTGLGAHALAAIETHAREQLLRKVAIHRDFCDALWLEAQMDREPRRETDESYYGVSSVFAARGGAL